MDIIADSGDYQNSGSRMKDNLMDNNSQEDSGLEVESESSDYDMDNMGQKVKKHYANEE